MTTTAKTTKKAQTKTTAKKAAKPAAKKTTAKKAAAKKPAATKKAAAKKPAAKTPAKKAVKKAVKKVSAYDKFIANVAVGQNVTVYNLRTNTTHTTRIVAVSERKITTMRDGSRDTAIYTGKGNGTGATEGTMLIPHTISHYRKPRKNAKVIAHTPESLRKTFG